MSERKWKSVAVVTPDADDPRCFLVAIDESGAMWWGRATTDPSWTQMPTVPDRATLEAK